MHRKVLGRGLEALIPSAVGTMDGPQPGVRELPVADIGANPFQPRSRFDDEGRGFAEVVSRVDVLEHGRPQHLAMFVPDEVLGNGGPRTETQRSEHVESEALT